MNIATRLIHSGKDVPPAPGALSVPLYHASTYAQQFVDDFGAWDYARTGNPTRQALEDAITELEGGACGCAFGSGMAAISSTLLLFRSGDHLVVSEDVYGGAFRVLTSVFDRWGLTATFVDSTRPESVATSLRDNTRAIYVETPSNPLLKITDLAAISAIARGRGIRTVWLSAAVRPSTLSPMIPCRLSTERPLDGANRACVPLTHGRRTSGDDRLRRGETRRLSRRPRGQGAVPRPRRHSRVVGVERAGQGDHRRPGPGGVGGTRR